VPEAWLKLAAETAMATSIFPPPTRESPPMFDSKLVDAFSRTHWSAVPILYVPAILCLLWFAVSRSGNSLGLAASMALLGAFAWTLAEYVLHRTVFHWQPPGAFGERFHFILHGVHHKWPRDQYRLVMPPAASMLLFWLFLLLWRGLIPGVAYAFHAGFVAGYIFYDLSHYYMHHGHPSTEWFKKLRKHHMVHHSPKLANEKKFGVSSTLWDHVFGTYSATEH
jgi:sterol desaturase/sphingolipid hydroxylase (fatty acid hydroxylase superfamily)